MTPAALADLVRSVARGVLVDHGLDPGALPDTVTVHRPRDSQHGDYATNVALQTGTRASVIPRDFAGWLAQELEQRPGVRTAEVAGPGFVNLWLDAQGEIIAQVIAAGQRYGASQMLAGQKFDVGAVHPTGPVHLADARRVVVGDALGRILAFAGATVGTASDGDPTTMADLVEAIGADAARYALIHCSRTSAASPISIDLNVWSKRTDDNPLFAVQYAHARLASLARNAADLGISASGAQLDLLDHHTEVELIHTLGEFPSVVGLAAARREPHRIARYLEQLAGAYHNFSATCRALPMGDESPGPLHAARLALCQATRQVLANGLGLLGISAPEQL